MRIAASPICRRVSSSIAGHRLTSYNVCYTKLLRLYSSRDWAISEPSLEARLTLTRCGRFHELLDSHVRAWQALWRRCDVTIGARDNEQMVLRLHIFHLLQSVSPNSIGRDVGVPARGLHGEAYRGHIFWDELFIFSYNFV